MITDINSEDRLVQAMFADYFRDTLGVVEKETGKTSRTLPMAMP